MTETIVHKKVRGVWHVVINATEFYQTSPDTAALHRCQKGILDSTSHDHPLVVFNFQRAKFLGGVAWGCIGGALRNVSGAGGKLAIVLPLSPQARQWFADKVEKLGIDRFGLELFESFEAAADSLTGSAA